MEVFASKSKGLFEGMYSITQRAVRHGHFVLTHLLLQTRCSQVCVNNIMTSLLSQNQMLSILPRRTRLEAESHKNSFTRGLTKVFTYPESHSSNSNNKSSKNSNILIVVVTVRTVISPHASCHQSLKFPPPLRQVQNKSGKALGSGLLSLLRNGSFPK